METWFSGPSTHAEKVPEHSSSELVENRFTWSQVKLGNGIFVGIN